MNEADSTEKDESIRSKSGSVYQKQAWTCNKQREQLKPPPMFFFFFGWNSSGRWFLSGTVPSNSSLMIVCGITVDKQLSFSQKKLHNSNF